MSPTSAQYGAGHTLTQLDKITKENVAQMNPIGRRLSEAVTVDHKRGD
jgi:hypothetical protein